MESQSKRDYDFIRNLKVETEMTTFVPRNHRAEDDSSDLLASVQNEKDEEDETISSNSVMTGTPVHRGPNRVYIVLAFLIFIGIGFLFRMLAKYVH